MVSAEAEWRCSCAQPFGGVRLVDAGGEQAEIVGQGAVGELGDACAQDGDRLGRRGPVKATEWGGAVRIFLLHHATFSINSLCHCFGRRPFATGDQSHNLAWLAPIAFGEAWHNNHHAFPTSARHGLGRRQLDPSAWLITGLERCHLAWDVVRISPERQQAKHGIREDMT